MAVLVAESSQTLGSHHLYLLEEPCHPSATVEQRPSGRPAIRSCRSVSDPAVRFCTGTVTTGPNFLPGVACNARCLLPGDQNQQCTKEEHPSHPPTSSRSGKIPRQRNGQHATRAATLCSRAGVRWRKETSRPRGPPPKERETGPEPKKPNPRPSTRRGECDGTRYLRPSKATNSTHSPLPKRKTQTRSLPTYKTPPPPVWTTQTLPKSSSNSLVASVLLLPSLRRRLRPRPPPPRRRNGEHARSNARPDNRSADFDWLLDGDHEVWSGTD